MRVNTSRLPSAFQDLKKDLKLPDTIINSRQTMDTGTMDTAIKTKIKVRGISISTVEAHPKSRYVSQPCRLATSSNRVDNILNSGFANEPATFCLFISSSSKCKYLIF